MLPNLPRDQQLTLLRKMLMIRRVEEHVVRFNEEHEGLIRGHFHIYIGQEATGVGVCSALAPEDYVFSTHRNHGHVIAKGGDPGKVLAEIIGRETGYCLGRGGTFHVAAPDLNIPHTSAIVGGSTALASGAALAAQYLESKAVTVVFFGDGAMDEGVFYESLSMAKLWNLPLIFLMENNFRRAGRARADDNVDNLASIPRALNVETTAVNGGNIGQVFDTVKELVQRTRAGEGPFFVEARTHPWPGNDGAHPELVAGITDINWAWDPGPVPEKLRSWYIEGDGILVYARELAKSEGCDRDTVIRVDEEVRHDADAAAEFALTSPLPAPEEAIKYAYAGRND